MVTKIKSLLFVLVVVLLLLPLQVITLPQRGRLDGCEPSQRRPLGLLLQSAFFLFNLKLLLMFNVFFNLLKLKAYR